MRKFGFAVEAGRRYTGVSVRPMTVPPLEDPKRNTWYYGVRCACERLLAVCEDRFQGKTDDAVLPVPISLTVQCPCGVATDAQVLQKFKTP
jgi:hypothetical protein